MFDFSDYPQDSKFFDLDDKSVFGKIRDKSKGKIIREFLGLRSKMYSLIAVDSREIKKEKAVNKNVVKNIRHEELKKYEKIQNKLHRIETYNKFFCLILMINDTY